MTESVEGTVYNFATPITDSAGNLWDIGSGRQPMINNVSAGGAADKLQYHNHIIYREINGLWYYYATGSWHGATDPNAATPVWSDEFTGSSISMSNDGTGGVKWRPVLWYTPNADGYSINGTVWMTNSFNVATPISNLYLTDGAGTAKLGLDKTPTAYSSACGGNAYVGAQLISTYQVTQGQFVSIKAKMPSVVGTNFALWLMRPGSTYSEIDIAEVVRGSTDVCWKISVWDTTDTLVAGAYDHFENDGTNMNLTGYDSTQWHQYDCWWDVGTGLLRFYLDQTQVFTTAIPSGYAGASMYIILSCEPGWSGTIPTTGAFPYYMLLDFVRVYSTKPY